MVQETTVSALALANRAMREARLEEAVALYSCAYKQAPPELTSHIGFNLKLLRRSVGGPPENPVILLSADASPASAEMPNCDVLVIMLATNLLKGAQAARLVSQRADHQIGIVILLIEPAENSVKRALGSLLGILVNKYALVVDENVFPSRDWLRCAYDNVKYNGEGIVYANNGLKIPGPRWQNALASPVLLQEIVCEGVPTSGQRIVEPSFVLADTSESDVDEPKFGQLHLVDIQQLHERDDGAPEFYREVCVVMPSVDPDTSSQKARLLLDRAGIEVDLVVAVDTLRQGFISTLNQVARRSQARYIVYLAEDAWPGTDWLRSAHERMQNGGAKLLAFNCGKWHGRVAAFGMVEKRWVYGLYGDQVLYEGYRAHRADNELTAIARGQGVYVYAEDCVLLEHDTKKDFRRTEHEAANFHPSDAKLFKQRFQSGFGGLVTNMALEPMVDEYLAVRKHYAARPLLEIAKPPASDLSTT